MESLLWGDEGEPASGIPSSGSGRVISNFQKSAAIGFVCRVKVRRISCPVIVDTDPTHIVCEAWGTCQILQCWTDGRVGMIGPCRTGRDRGRDARHFRATIRSEGWEELVRMRAMRIGRMITCDAFLTTTQLTAEA